MKEGKGKLGKMEELSEKVIPNTSTEGQDTIFKEVHETQNRFEILKKAISEVP